MQRREFLATMAAGAMAGPESQFVKGICNVIFPVEMPLGEQFRLARNAGFEGIEIRLGHELDATTPRDAAERIGDEARRARIAISSLWVSNIISDTPLNHPDPAVRAKGVETLDRSIDVARWVGCGALLIVPGRLGTGPRFEYGYQDTWDRVTGELRKLTAHAAEARVYLTPENVWNRFLVSPLEMKAFLDQFESPWVQAHFDIGNVMQFGYPQDWILTLGPRLKRIHVKDYKLSARAGQGRFVDLWEGDVDWKSVMAALQKVNYRGFLDPEIGPDAADADRLKKVSSALDRILAMA